MLLRSNYFFSFSEKAIKRIGQDQRYLKIISIEKGPEELPFISMYITEEIPKKLAKIWHVPYNKFVNPMVRVKVVYDTTYVTQHWKDYDRLVEYSDKAHIGDPRNKEWQEKVATTDWIPNFNKAVTEYAIISFKYAGGNIIPEPDIPVTNIKIRDEMSIFGLGMGYPKNSGFNTLDQSTILALKTILTEEEYGKRFDNLLIPALRWNFNPEDYESERAYKKWWKDHPNVVSSDYAPKIPTRHRIDKFYLEMRSVESDYVTICNDTDGSIRPSKLNEDVFERYNGSEEDYFIK